MDMINLDEKWIGTMVYLGKAHRALGTQSGHSVRKGGGTIRMENMYKRCDFRRSGDLGIGLCVTMLLIVSEPGLK